MQVSGRVVVLSIFALALAMSAWAWQYHYAATRRMVGFWGPEAAHLLVRGEEVDGFSLAPNAARPAEGAYPNWPPAFIDQLNADAVAYHDLTGAKGLIHFRHALTQDSSYDWDAAQTNAEPRWGLAFRFSDGDDATWVLLSDDLAALGKPAPDGKSIATLPCPRMGPVLREYFEDIGVVEKAVSQ